MVAWEGELRAHVRVACETNRFGGPSGLDWQARCVAAGSRAAGREAVGRLDLAARIGVQAAGAVTRFTAGIERIGSLDHQAGVIGGGEVAIKGVMTLFAFLGANVFCTGN